MLWVGLTLFVVTLQLCFKWYTDAPFVNHSLTKLLIRGDSILPQPEAKIEVNDKRDYAGNTKYFNS